MNNRLWIYIDRNKIFNQKLDNYKINQIKYNKNPYIYKNNYLKKINN